jgi:hypothetical protein
MRSVISPRTPGPLPSTPRCWAARQVHQPAVDGVKPHCQLGELRRRLRDVSPPVPARWFADGAAVAQSPVAGLDEPGDGAFDRWSPAAVVGLPAGVGGGLTAGGCLEVVARAEGPDTSGLGFGAPLASVKEALRWWCCPPASDRGTVCPAGQVTMAAVVSMTKSSRVNPPGTAGRSGAGLRISRCPASWRAWRTPPVE